MREILDAGILCLLAVVPIIAFGAVVFGWWILIGRKATAELGHARAEEKFRGLDPRCVPALVPHRKRFHPKCPTVWIALPEMTFDQPGVGRA